MKNEIFLHNVRMLILLTLFAVIIAALVSIPTHSSSTEAAAPAYYIDETGNTVAVTSEPLTQFTVATTAMDDGSWYYIDNNITAGSVTVSGDVHLIIMDGFTLEVTTINMNASSTLQIYPGSSTSTVAKTGKLTSAGTVININGAECKLTNVSNVTGGNAGVNIALAATNSTIDNYGGITGNGTTYTGGGIRSAAAGTVIKNYVSGTIISAWCSIYLTADTTIINENRISGTAYGISSNNKVSITNNAGGTITGDATGIFLGTGATNNSTIDNYGGITGNGNSIDSNGGIYSGGTGTVVNNYVTGTITGGYNGVNLLVGGTITNDNLISGINYGINSNGKASVTNNDGGTITSGGTGIIFKVNAANSTIYNYGMIKGTGIQEGSGGVFSSVAGTAVNNYATGTIAGGYDGISFSSNGTIINDNLISGTTYGLYLRGTVSFTNNEGGTVTGGSDGVNANYGATNSTIDNYGEIIGRGYRGIYSLVIIVISNYATGKITSVTGILLITGGTVTNYNLISGTSYGINSSGKTTVTNKDDGKITGGTNGVNLSSAANSTIDNYGSIDGTLTSGYGINSATNVVITNNMRGTINGGATGIYLSAAGAANSTIDNYGVITGNGTGATGGGIYSVAAGTIINNYTTGTIDGGTNGFYLGAGGTITNENLISGTTNGIFAGASVNITNYSKIIGNVALSNAYNEVTFSAGSRIEGDFNIGTGNSTLRFIGEPHTVGGIGMYLYSTVTGISSIMMTTNVSFNVDNSWTMPTLADTDWIILIGGGSMAMGHLSSPSPPPGGTAQYFMIMTRGGETLIAHPYADIGTTYVSRSGAEVPVPFPPMVLDQDAFDTLLQLYGSYALRNNPGDPNNGWYIVEGNVTLNSQIVIDSNLVYVILADGSKVTVNGSIGLLVRSGYTATLLSNTLGGIDSGERGVLSVTAATGDVCGIEAEPNSTITNTAEVNAEAPDTSRGSGVYADALDIIVNGVTGIIRGNSYGTFIATGGAVANYGIIMATDSNGQGIYSDSQVVISNGFTIGTAYIYGASAAIMLDTGSGGSSVTNARGGIIGSDGTYVSDNGIITKDIATIINGVSIGDPGLIQASSNGIIADASVVFTNNSNVSGDVLLTDTLNTVTFGVGSTIDGDFDISASAAGSTLYFTGTPNADLVYSKVTGIGSISADTTVIFDVPAGVKETEALILIDGTPDGQVTEYNSMQPPHRITTRAYPLGMPDANQLIAFVGNMINLEIIGNGSVRVTGTDFNEIYSGPGTYPFIISLGTSELTFAAENSAGSVSFRLNNDPAVNQGPVTFPMANGDTVTATFEAGSTGPKMYTIWAMSDSGSTITPSGKVTVQQGDNQTFAFKAKEGYKITEVLIDGLYPLKQTEIDSGSYTFPNVMSNHTIQVKSVTSGPGNEITLTINTAEGSGFATYSVDGSPPIKYTDPVRIAVGSDVTVTATSDEGYVFNKWNVDGQTYTSPEVAFENVSTSMSLDLHFKAESGPADHGNSPLWCCMICILLIVAATLILIYLYRKRRSRQ
ncbi:hypothetical protein Mpt1_c13120 [Candidatus Methanoplasma termitum]|uniref:Bacterial repeat domain-containing protein n=1 Tax=Candidatus Methanoplasma termitum TaxID=1577791 RepID=A0A0A7LDN1_9ARCH|nr:hypothetical protein Mpt1_c13120 [Candidatus Methanoplasma termitum]